MSRHLEPYGTPSAWAFLTDIGKDPGKLRDASLLVGGLVYLSGYITWSIVAWLEGLGPVPALDAQYLVAGFPTVLALAFMVGLIIGTRRIFDLWPAFFDKLTPRSKALSVILLTLTPLAGLLFSVALSDQPSSFEQYRSEIDMAWLPDWFLRFHYYSQLPLYWSGEWLKQALGFSALPQRPRLLYSVLAFSAVWTAFTALPMARGRQVVWLTSMYVLPLLIGAAALNIYVQDVYSNVPQALGGARSRRGVLDLRVADFSQQTLSALGAGLVNDSSPNHVVSSEEVAVRSVTDTTLIVQLSTDPSTPGRYLELSRSGVLAIRWADERRSPPN